MTYGCHRTTFRFVTPHYVGDDNKNKTSEAISGTMSGDGFTVGSSGYDDEDRLVNWQRDDTNLDQSWSLSAVGDWNSITENSSTQNRTHGAAHELLTAATESITHDVSWANRWLARNRKRVTESKKGQEPKT